MPRRGRNEEIPEKLSLKINGLIFLRTDNRGAVIFFRSCDDLFNNLHARHEYFLPQLYPLHLILPLQGMKVNEEDITHAPNGVSRWLVVRLKKADDPHQSYGGGTEKIHHKPHS